MFSTDPSEGVSQLLALFTEELDQVSFPEVDASVLQAGLEAVEHATQAVQEHQRALLEAQAKCDEKRVALERLAKRAKAYARVYATDDPELLARIEAIELDQAPPKKPRARKGRKPRARPHEPELPLTPEAVSRPDGEAA